jgi:hypothetical protein
MDIPANDRVHASSDALTLWLEALVRVFVLSLLLAGCTESVLVEPAPLCHGEAHERIGRIFLAWESGDERCPIIVDSITDEAAASLVPVFCEGTATACSAEYTCAGQVGGPVRGPSEFDVRITDERAHLVYRFEGGVVYCEADYTVVVQPVTASGGLNEPGLNSLAWPRD